MKVRALTLVGSSVLKVKEGPLGGTTGANPMFYYYLPYVYYGDDSTIKISAAASTTTAQFHFNHASL